MVFNGNNNFTDNTYHARQKFILIYMMMHTYPINFNQFIF
jgi:hypothetical protein